MIFGSLGKFFSIQDLLKFQVPETKVEFANSVGPDEVAHNEPPHLNLLCLPI